LPTIAAHDDPMERLPAIKQVPDERSSVLGYSGHVNPPFRSMGTQSRMFD
jgi:hypothetical protein